MHLFEGLVACRTAAGVLCTLGGGADISRDGTAGALELDGVFVEPASGVPVANGVRHTTDLDHRFHILGGQAAVFREEGRAHLHANPSKALESVVHRAGEVVRHLAAVGKTGCEESSRVNA